MSEQKVYNLSPGQSVFFNSAYKYTLATSGLGGGKTFIGCLRLINKVSKAPGSLNLVAAPTFPMLRDSTYRTFMSLAPDGFVLDFNANDGTMKVRAGTGTAEILWRSLVKYEFLRGIEFMYEYIDELALCHPMAWKIARGRLRQKLPGLPGVKPQGWATTTPRGKNFVYHEWVMHPTKRHAWVHWPGTDNNANLPEGYYEDLGYTGSFYDQEVKGLFAAFDGLVYQFEDEPEAFNSHVKEPPENMSWRDVIGGLDFGYRDPTAACVFGLRSDLRAWQIGEYYQRKANFYDTVIPAILDLSREHHVSTWYCDSSEPDKIEELRRAADREGVDTIFRAVEKGPGSIISGVQTVQWMLAKRDDGSRGLLVSPECTNTRKEYGSYQYDTKDVGERSSSDVPQDMNNHAMDATRYALHSVFGRHRGDGSVAVAVSTQTTPTLERLFRQTQQAEEDLDKPDSPFLTEQEERDVRRRAQNARIISQLRGLGGLGNWN